jgi:lipopolysaccharide/colanic/teichoic acid biosynthesis glycosyltransferase
MSSWCHSRGKRAFDLLCTIPVFVILFPVMVCVAAAVKLTSEGPVFFRQERVGKEGREFQLLKFRTMFHRRPECGPCLTQAGDPRVTSVGRLLRKWKLDELPQFINVIKGDMSLIGPRPDLPQYLESLAPNQRSILQLFPGLTGVATLLLRHEEELLSMVPPGELEHYYACVLLPEKIRLDMEYASQATFLSDIRILLLTLIFIFR